MKKFLRWIRKHVRPTLKFKKPLVDEGEDINVENVKDNIKDGAEVGIKIKLKF